MKTKKEYTIDRSKWCCGGDRFIGGGDSALMNDKQRMCCLGQICNQAGIPKKKLLWEGEPDSIISTVKVPSWLLNDDGNRNSQIANKMININDNDVLTQKEREQQLKKETRKAGIKLTFKGKLGLKRCPV